MLSSVPATEGDELHHGPIAISFAGVWIDFQDAVPYFSVSVSSGDPPATASVRSDL